MDIDKLIEQLRWWADNCDRTNYGCQARPFLLDAATALSTLKGENEKMRAELERMKKIMRDNGIMTIPPKYPGGPTEWNIPKPRGKKKED